MIRRGRALALVAALLLLAAQVASASANGAGTDAAAGPAAQATQALQAPTVVVVVMDGCPADTIRLLPETSFLRAAMRGEMTTVFPSSTAAGHAAIFTGTYPEENGITGKGYLGDDGSVAGFDSPDLFERPTLFSVAKAAGMTTVMVSAKAAVLRRLAANVDVLLYADDYPDVVAEKAGDPPPTSEQYADYAGWNMRLDMWLLNALTAYIESDSQSSMIGVNLGSPDKCGHRFGPAPAAETLLAMESIDGGLARVAGALEATRPGNWCMIITSDHGMTPVDTGITVGDMVDAATAVGGGEVAMTLDGGCAYFWSDEATCAVLATQLRAHPGVDEVIEAGNGARRAELRIRHPRIPPLVAMVKEGFMFTESEMFMDYTKGSHGTAGIRTDVMVPLIVCGPAAPGEPAMARAHSVTDIYGLAASVMGRF